MSQASSLNVSAPELPPAGRAVPCCVDVPPVVAAKARYGVRMLLLPLGIDPTFVAPEALPAGGLYYGPNPPEASVLLHHDPAVLPRFERPAPLDPADVAWVTWREEDIPVLFGKGETADLVMSAFFWLSGWQEHVSPERDEHGRFPFAASLQARLGTAVRPAVDAYREILAERLQAAGVPVRRRRWGGRAWALCPTHDVDYLRKWRPGLIYREAVLYFLRNRRREAFPARLRRLGAFARDWLSPGDPCRTALERMPREVAVRGGTATYFFKTAARDPHDVSYRADTPYLRRFLQALRADGFEVGLHPSYPAHDDERFLAEERDRLAALTGEAPVSVRQHYLRYALPQTPRLHAALGFRIDSTLGFAEHEGFRHATCHPFELYDVGADRPLGVWEMPLALMESAVFNRRGLGEEGARAATQAVLDAVRRFGGAAVVLWHNTLWDELDYPGWGRHFVETLDHARAGGALIAGLRDALAGWRAGPAERS